MNEAQLLFTDLLDCSWVELYLNRKRRLGRKEGYLAAGALRRRLYAEPIQYILGKSEFMGLSFRVQPGVFIPRPETEILAESAINILKLQNSPLVEILDIGTGCGNIAVALASFLPNARITATDISEQALELAKANAQLNGVEINFLQSDLFANRALGDKYYAAIVSNPPYLSRRELTGLASELSHEPAQALEAGRDGLAVFRRIIRESAPYLKKGGFLIMEMGYNQCEAIRDLFDATGRFEIVEIVKDYNSIDRVIVARCKSIDVAKGWNRRYKRLPKAS